MLAAQFVVATSLRTKVMVEMAYGNQRSNQLEGATWKAVKV